MSDGGERGEAREGPGEKSNYIRGGRMILETGRRKENREKEERGKHLLSFISPFFNISSRPNVSFGGPDSAHVPLFAPHWFNMNPKVIIKQARTSFLY